ncbi:aminotransferase class III-fold pyridoxal phosphate-dependent enzyme [Xinfangfangia sp. CPCC 101601]|uniref:Aminotransferase class III-fold pyridoxal phosphate-dependent enzyme n=1 Tax=Pseudogemmobacter lacusdianii TaxID=3069608 RepID=A0ABU0VXM1_9RHOB|nr:aminotransferase class III-fold pyridoxal phosphate-dependent enzyme [Xinfangfangia sp. CPCC 101601]MDQ2066506.1 aminotransferase class III-fold pyridoxal phosphate-dependent enzyme [Xinfangfangia sp. CPCC 101601]
MSETHVERRARLMGPNVPTFYRSPVHLVRGEGVWLWDAAGKRYLDCYNNVPHVGHCHPKVVEAIAKQAATLNTHTRYLHDMVLDYLERLLGTFKNGIGQGILTCTGSEANDIALRMAQAATGKTGIIVTDDTYHGNTTAVSQLSARRPQIGERWPNVRLVPAPNSLLRPDPDGTIFAGHVKAAMAELAAAGFGTSALLICPMFANEGLPSLAPGWLAPTEAALRAEGALIIADEVQPGFGRSGSHFWGHERLGFKADIVTMGKPMGNGHPVAAVVTTPEIMASFRNVFSYFNTFGGNPVSAAAAMAVLQVIEEEGLQERAAKSSAYVKDRLEALNHPLIADVRANGLFFAVELRDGDKGATAFSVQLVENMVARGFLMNVIGADRNVLKIRPPMAFDIEHADLLIDALAAALAETKVPA